jgi:quercetin dioxygenase-like cupin family protein
MPTLMSLHSWNEIASEQMNPLVSRKVRHTDRLTISRLELKQGAVVPEHHHENEQVSMVESGCLRFILGAEETLVAAGQLFTIPSNVPHSVIALEDSIAVDVFTPRREDWIRGDDAYLRGR